MQKGSLMRGRQMNKAINDLVEFCTALGELFCRLFKVRAELVCQVFVDGFFFFLMLYMVAQLLSIISTGSVLIITFR